MNAPIRNSRRQFFKQSAGLLIGFSIIPQLFADDATPDLPIDLKNNPNINSWLFINPNGKIDIYSGKVEFGQGIATAFKQIVADEMDVDINRVNILPSTTGISPNEGVTSGSQSVEYGGLALRYACAQARGTLLEKASQSLNVPVSNLKIKDGVITAANGKTATYWDLSSKELLLQKADGKYKPKPITEHNYIGQSIERIDIPAKVSGGEAYVQDMRLPGMLHARIIRPPAPRATLQSMDDASIKALPGVVAVVKNGSFVAVVAKREEQAIEALNQAKTLCQWNLKNDLPNSTQDWLKTMLDLPSTDTDHAVKQDTSKKSVKTIQNVFTKPFIAHGSIGPSCAVAILKDEVTTVYTHSQGMYPLHKDIVKALNVAPEKVVCIHKEGSGMYGQSGADDVALEAVLIAQVLPNQPIRLQWMRDDEFKWEPYGSAMTIKIKAGLDENGKVVEWNQDIFSNTHSTRPGEKTGNNLVSSWYMANPQTPSPVTNIPLPAGGSHRNGIPMYSFANQKITNHLIEKMPIRVSALRTLGAYGNVFAIESTMDELAKAAKADPVEFRLAHLDNPRAKDVLTKVAQMAKWQSKKNRIRTDGKVIGRGVGFAQYKNLQVYCAVIVDVEIDRSGHVKVRDMWAAVDSGLVVNPNGVKNQIEGGLLQTTSWTLHEEIKFDQAGIKTTSWGEYPILRFDEVPNVYVELINRPNEKALGVGEGSQGPGVAAIANAVAAATNSRIYDLPMTPNKVKKLFS
jgi:CO/xanthine dehydrogenase Mo-binding subunit